MIIFDLRVHKGNIHHPKCSEDNNQPGLHHDLIEKKKQKKKHVLVIIMQQAGIKILFSYEGYFEQNLPKVALVMQKCIFRVYFHTWKMHV